MEKIIHTLKNCNSKSFMKFTRYNQIGDNGVTKFRNKLLQTKIIIKKFWFIDSSSIDIEHK